MTHFRWRYRVQGAHVRVLLYVGVGADATHALSGELTLTIGEWDALSFDLRVRALRDGVEVHDLVDIGARE